MIFVTFFHKVWMTPTWMRTQYLPHPPCASPPKPHDHRWPKSSCPRTPTSASSRPWAISWLPYRFSTPGKGVGTSPPFKKKNVPWKSLGVFSNAKFLKYAKKIKHQILKALMKEELLIIYNLKKNWWIVLEISWIIHVVKWKHLREILLDRGVLVLQWILVITLTVYYVISVITLETQNTKPFPI